MAYVRRNPSPPLAPFIDHLWAFEDETVPVTRGELWADACIDMMVNLSAPQRLQRGADESRWQGAWVSGPRTVPVGIELESRRFTMVGVRFRPGGASPFFGLPAHEIVDRVVDLQSFWGSDARESVDRAASAPDGTSRLDALETMLLRRFTPTAPMRDAVATMAASLNMAPHGEVSGRAQQLGVSREHLRRLFRRYVGLSPKAFQKVCRFRELLRKVAIAPTHPDWVQLALAAGYYDQAHLCGDFRTFAGHAPTHGSLPRGPQPDYLPLPARAPTPDHET